jgi:Spy/CpxP family protein refolding chaperone
MRQAITAMVLLAAMSLSAPAMAADKASPDPQPPSDSEKTGNAGSELRKAGKHLGNAAHDAAKTSREKLRKVGKKITEETGPVQQDVKRGINKLLQKKDRAPRTNTTKVEPSTEVTPPAKTP